MLLMRRQMLSARGLLALLVLSLLGSLPTQSASAQRASEQGLTALQAIMMEEVEDDTRVHPSQSLEMYRHLKVRKPDVPVRLVMYPGEGHGYVRATAQYDYVLRMMRWFDTYLKQDGPMPEGPLEVKMVATETSP